jgi:aminocarboxymuconate-semialdehyde decarboxylase
MRKVDKFNHIFPTAYWNKMIELAGEYEDLGKRVRSVPMLMDMDERFRVMDMFDDYQQILSLTAPPLEVMFDKDTAPEMARIANDGMAEICQKYPDRFPGYTASMPMNNPDAAVAETNRVMDGSGALGIQIYTNVAGRALDNPEYFQIFENASDLDIPIWMHPARGADMADYKDEDKSKYEIWWTFGWPYETSVAQARMVFSGMIDRLENFKIITHHLGGLSPFHSGRTGPGWQFLGDRTSGPAGDEYRNAKDGLKKPHAEYFKDFYADTAVFGSIEATVCGLEYYPRDRVLFASDAPFDPEKGPMYIRETIKILDELEIDDDWREDLYWRNAAKIMNLPEKA